MSKKDVKEVKTQLLLLFINSAPLFLRAPLDITKDQRERKKLDVLCGQKRDKKKIR